jgi:hypothetical protein
MKKSLITINNENLRIRPSAIESFYSCPFSWGKTFLEGASQGPNNSRASIGTAIHAGVENMWQDAIKSGKKDPNLGAITDAAMESWKLQKSEEGVTFGAKENEESCVSEIISGSTAFIEDIVPFTSIPTGVEEFFKIDIADNPFISELGGTVDYINSDTIADVKTSKRKSGPEGHSVQQSVYKMLANANGHKIEHNLIQQVVLTKNPTGNILQLEADIPQAKWLINGMLDVMDLIAKDVAPIETILRPNPKHIFCSEKFCPHHASCPAVKGNLLQSAQVAVKIAL